MDASMPGALEQAFAFLETVSVGRHMIFVAPPSRGGPPEAAQWEPVLERARATAVSVQAVSDSSENPGKVTKACERAYLMLLCGFEIASQGSGEASSRCTPDGVTAWMS
jgi:hypothetical protein